MGYQSRRLPAGSGRRSDWLRRVCQRVAPRSRALILVGLCLKVVAVNGLSIPVTDNSLSELKYSVAEDVNEGRSSWMTAQIF
jgi:hypothetical protein